MARKKSPPPAPEPLPEPVEGVDFHVPPVLTGGNVSAPCGVATPSPTPQNAAFTADNIRGVEVTSDAQLPTPAGVENSPTYSQTNRLKQLMAELAERACESLRIYEPLPIIAAFHADRC